MERPCVRLLTWKAAFLARAMFNLAKTCTGRVLQAQPIGPAALAFPGWRYIYLYSWLFCAGDRSPECRGSTLTMGDSRPVETSMSPTNSWPRRTSASPDFPRFHKLYEFLPERKCSDTPRLSPVAEYGHVGNRPCH
jgi:hypothetical protein